MAQFFSLPHWVVTLGKIALTVAAAATEGELSASHTLQTHFIDVPQVEIPKTPAQAQAILTQGIVRSLVLQDGTTVSIKITPPGKSAFTQSLTSVMQGKNDDIVTATTQYFSLSDEQVAQISFSGAGAGRSIVSIAGEVGVSW